MNRYFSAMLSVRHGRARFSGLLLLLNLLLSACLASAVHAEPATLRFLTWADYIDPALIEDFQREYDARVVREYFETDDTRDDILAAQEGAGYDLMVVSGAVLGLYQQRGWLAELAPQAIPTRRHIDPHWQRAYPASEDHGVAYFWGSLGIAYRSDRLEQPLSHWRQLLEPIPALQGRILMINDGRDLFALTLKSLGFSVNSDDPTAIAAAGELLLAQRPFVREYGYPTLEADSVLATGEVWAATLYNGDAVFLQDVEPAIAFSVPGEGTVLWVDYLAVSASALNPQLAMDFIEFLNRPGVAAQNARYVNFATPNRAAEALLPAEFLEDPLIYPPPAVLARSEFLRPPAPETLRQRNRLLQDLLP